MRRAAIAISMALLAASGSALAQSSIVSQIAGDKVATENLYFSLKFGMNVAHLTGTEGTERTGGFAIGLSATIKLNDKLSLVPEIMPFSRKGITNVWYSGGVLDPYLGESADSALALTYIDIPVIFKYRLGRFHAGAGPFVGFLTSATERFRTEPGTGEELRLKRDVTEQYRAMDYGLVFEASWTIRQPRRGMGLILHVRYQAGLADVLKDPAASGSVRNSVVQVCLSFPFVIGDRSS